MNALNQLVAYIAGLFSNEPTTAHEYFAWAIVILAILAILLVLRWLVNWFFHTNEIVANQKHIIALLETHRSMATNGRQANAIPAPSAPTMMVPQTQIRQHPIDDEFSEILNVRPHNMGGQRVMRPQPLAPQPVPQVVTNAAPAQPMRLAPNIPPAPATSPPVPNVNVPAQASPVMSAPSQPSGAAPFSPQPNMVTSDPPTAEIQAKPVNTSVTMLGSPEQRAERQLEAREAMRLAEQAANATRSKTADIPNIPTALVRTYSATKTNPLTGKRVGDNPASNSDGDRQDGVPSQFQLRD